MRTDKYMIALPHFPLDEKELSVIASHSDVTPSGGKSKSVAARQAVGFTYAEEAGKPCVYLQMQKLATTLGDRGVGPTWDVTLEVVYPKR